MPNLADLELRPFSPRARLVRRSLGEGGSQPPRFQGFRFLLSAFVLMSKSSAWPESIRFPLSSFPRRRSPPAIPHSLARGYNHVNK